jgi:hypothetical protein
VSSGKIPRLTHINEVAVGARAPTASILKEARLLSGRRQAAWSDSYSLVSRQNADRKLAIEKQVMDNSFQYDVFLSHSAENKALVHDVAARLKQDSIRVWLDEEKIKPGDSITVAPIQTLTGKEFQIMRDQSFALIRAVGVADVTQTEVGVYILLRFCARHPGRARRSKRGSSRSIRTKEASELTRCKFS